MITCSGSIMAQNPELIKVWASRTSSEERKSPGTAFEKAQLLKKGLEKKKKSLSLIDEFAYWAMAFEASTEKAKVANEAEIVLKLRQFEVLTFSMSVQMDTLYPGILGWYQNFDAKWSRFRFNTEPVQPIGFADMAESAREESEPTDAVEAIRFHTVNVQKELFLSKNLVISKDYERMMRIYWSLEDSVRSIVDRQGYPSFWKEQLACFANKSANKAWACECGFKKNPVFESEKGCIGKNINLNRTVALQDPKTSILVRLVDGNLKATREATDAMLTTWGNVQNSIPSQIIFWWCVELGVTKPSDQMRINFRKLWAEGRNDYNLAIGLDSATVANLEDYFVCRLGIKSVSIIETTIRPAMIEEANLVSPQKTSQKKEILKNTVPRKEGVVTTHSDTYKKQISVPSTEKALVAIGTTKPEGGFDLEAIAPKLKELLQDNLDLHDGLKGCVDAIPMGENRIRIILTGCGVESKGIFNIAETENPIAQDFYNVCGNLTYVSILRPFVEKFNGTLGVTVTGTADTLKCVTCNNDTLAKQRAENVKKHLGSKLLDAIGGEDNVRIFHITNDLERRVYIDIDLIYPEGQEKKTTKK